MAVSRSSGSVRWAFNFRSWHPTESEWLLAAQCCQLEDKERIGKFVFKRDAKASMIGKLLGRKFVHLASGVPYEDIIIDRIKGGKPYAKNVEIPLTFNISHQGDYTVLVGEVHNDFHLGVDVMHFERKTGHELSEFFRIMRKTCSRDEWDSILSFQSDEKQSARFFRHWCLKESYLKALGLAVHSNLQHISFKINTPSLSQEKVCDDTALYLDGKEHTSFVFHEWLIDPVHCVSVALCSPAGEKPAVEAVPFKTLSWKELTQEAKPLLAPDVDFTQEFMKKEERPGCQY